MYLCMYVHIYKYIICILNRMGKIQMIVCIYDNSINIGLWGESVVSRKLSDCESELLKENKGKSSRERLEKRLWMRIGNAILGVCMYMYVHVCDYAYVGTDWCCNMHVHIYILFVCTSLRMCMYVHVFVCMYVNFKINTYQSKGKS